MIEPGSVLTLDVEKPTAGGRMLARHHGHVVLVWGAIPGERVTARVDQTKKSVAFASTLDVLSASPDRRDVMADPRCGGNVLAHVAYERQRALKGEIIRDALGRIGRIPLDRAPDCHGVARARLPHARAPACRERPAWLLSRGKPRAVRRCRDRATGRVHQCVDCRRAGDASQHPARWRHGGRDRRERHRRRARVPSRSSRGYRRVCVRRACQRPGRPVGAAGGFTRGRDAGRQTTRDRCDPGRGGRCRGVSSPHQKRAGVFPGQPVSRDAAPATRHGARHRRASRGLVRRRRAVRVGPAGDGSRGRHAGRRRSRQRRRPSGQRRFVPSTCTGRTQQRRGVSGWPQISATGES